MPAWPDMRCRPLPGPLVPSCSGRRITNAGAFKWWLFWRSNNTIIAVRGIFKVTAAASNWKPDEICSMSLKLVIHREIVWIGHYTNQSSSSTTVTADCTTVFRTVMVSKYPQGLGCSRTFAGIVSKLGCKKSTSKPGKDHRYYPHTGQTL